MRLVPRLFLVCFLLSFTTLILLNLQVDVHVVRDRSSAWQEDPIYCLQFPLDMSTYPHCVDQIGHLQKIWRTRVAYAYYGVDGSTCSIRPYLATVERICPPLVSIEQDREMTQMIKFAEFDTDLFELFGLFRGSSSSYDFIRSRLTENWPSWISALDLVISKYPSTMSKRMKMNIMLHLGFLSEETPARSVENERLGMFMQWTDLFACLFLLGHNLYISADQGTFMDYLELTNSASIDSHVDLLITDIPGYKWLRKSNLISGMNKCRIRLLDSFGTHVEFSDLKYYDEHTDELGGKGNPDGGFGLNLLQHWTLYPHTPDNDFLGFAVHRSVVEPMFERGSHSPPISLVYGKVKNRAVLEILKNLTEVHTYAQFSEGKGAPLNIINHGLLNASAVTSLLKAVDVIVGVGLDLEGPMPLEAMANGAVFVNAKFNPPISRLNYELLSRKPSLRQLNSQSPYLEQIGEPYVYTVNFDDPVAFEEAIRKAVNKPVNVLPEEYTPEGMLIRVHVLISRDFCLDVPNWPPSSAFVLICAPLQPKMGEPEQSCETACLEAGLVCEPAFFPLVNTKEFLRSYAGCALGEIDISPDPIAPYKCSVQGNPLMFSCASRPSRSSRFVRICPCRDYMLGQVAICDHCLS